MFLLKIWIIFFYLVSSFFFDLSRIVGWIIRLHFRINKNFNDQVVYYYYRSLKPNGSIDIKSITERIRHFLFISAKNVSCISSIHSAPASSASTYAFSIFSRPKSFHPTHRPKPERNWTPQKAGSSAFQENKSGRKSDLKNI